MATIKDDTLVLVKNRARGGTGYTLDNNVHRDFAYQEEKRVPFKELVELTYAPGGQYILDNYLVIEDKEVLELLNMQVEPEYFYSEADIRKILFEAEMPEFEDFIDFAPKGAIDLAVNIAVTEKIPDVRKREILSNKSGINIDNAIRVNEVMADEDEVEAEAPKQRRVQPKEEQTAAPQRRATDKYKVVTKK